MSLARFTSDNRRHNPLSLFPNTSAVFLLFSLYFGSEQLKVEEREGEKFQMSYFSKFDKWRHDEGGRMKEGECLRHLQGTHGEINHQKKIPGKVREGYTYGSRKK